MRDHSALRNWLRVTGVIYTLGALDYTLRPHSVNETLAVAGGERVVEAEPGIYHSLASAYMAPIGAMAPSAAPDPEARRDLIRPLLVAKATPSAGMLYRYFR